jgi:hypothetical protein
MRTWIMIVVAWLVFSPVLQAQGEWAAVKALSPGTAVRANQIAGILELANDAEIVVSGNVIPRKQVNRVEVLGVKGNRADRAAVGAVIGAVAGATLIAVNEFGRLQAGMVYGSVAGVVGALTGNSSTHRVIYER